MTRFLKALAHAALLAALFLMTLSIFASVECPDPGTTIESLHHCVAQCGAPSDRR